MCFLPFTRRGGGLRFCSLGALPLPKGLFQLDSSVRQCDLLHPFGGKFEPNRFQREDRMMNDVPEESRGSFAGFLSRLDNAEPYVAIRVAIVQAGLAVALSIAGASPKMMFLGMGEVVDRKTAFDFGYPIRELIWAGEMWRVAVGVFFPPAGLGLFLLSSLLFLSIAKVVERNLTRWNALLLYALGGSTVMLVDLCAYPGVTSGGLGMVYTAAGAVWTIHRIKPTEELEPLPRGLLPFGIILAFLAFLCAFPGLYDPAFQASLAQRSLVFLLPSATALLAATLTGVTVVLPLAQNRLLEGQLSTFSSLEGRLSQGSNRFFYLSFLWAVVLVVFCSHSWWTGNPRGPCDLAAGTRSERGKQPGGARTGGTLSSQSGRSVLAKTSRGFLSEEREVF